MSESEPRNPFYLLLLIASFVFVATALAYAVVPVLEQKATEAGTPPPPSPFRDGLREHGGTWLLALVAAMGSVAGASLLIENVLKRTMFRHRAFGRYGLPRAMSFPRPRSPSTTPP